MKARLSILWISLILLEVSLIFGTSIVALMCCNCCPVMRVSWTFSFMRFCWVVDVSASNCRGQPALSWGALWRRWMRTNYRHPPIPTWNSEGSSFSRRLFRQLRVKMWYCRAFVCAAVTGLQDSWYAGWCRVTESNCWQLATPQHAWWVLDYVTLHILFKCEGVTSCAAHHQLLLLSVTFSLCHFSCGQLWPSLRNRFQEREKAVKDHRE